MVSPVSILPRDGDVGAAEAERWLQSLTAHRGSDDVARLREAIAVAAERHAGETLPDGTGKLLGLLQTADILDGLKLDAETLVVALLSEIPRTSDFDAAAIARRFGDRVAGMLKLASRMRDLSASGVGRAQDSDVEALRRLLLGLADDVRVLLVVLAKRLRLMRGLHRLDAEARHKVASETRLVHAPLANRLGIWQMKWELEDLSLRYLEPATYKELARQLDGKRREREDFIARVIERLQSECREHEINAEITGRPKHIYSIWKKMQRKGVSFDQVFDVRAVRVLVDTVAECYEVLGIVHGLWRPVPGEFDDYIARPKGNGYSSLHTAVVGEDGRPLEIQVRTREMHEHAERGVAAHWRYKEARGADGDLERRIHWMRRWLENPEDVPDEGDEAEFEARQIYVLTPQGRVIELPLGATAVDFAYAIHTSVGHRCRGAKADGRIITLTQPLDSGQTIEILTAKEGGPSRDWLNPHSGYVATARAKNRIRHWFKVQDYDAHVHAGRAALDRELGRLSVSRPDLDRLAPRFNFQSVDDLLAAIGRGDLSAIQVANTQAEHVRRDPDAAPLARPVRKRPAKEGAQAGAQVEVQGIGDLLTQMARCCKPVPYDPIIGFITRGRGVTVHRRDCTVVRKMGPEQRERLVEVRWADDQPASAFLVDVHIFAADRKGLLRDITSVFTNDDIDVLGVKTQSDRRHERASMRFTVEVRDMTQLSHVLGRLAQIPDVLDVRRHA
jgi:GTP pyrophosphokinase